VSEDTATVTQDNRSARGVRWITGLTQIDLQT